MSQFLCIQLFNYAIDDDGNAVNGTADITIDGTVDNAVDGKQESYSNLLLLDSPVVRMIIVIMMMMMTIIIVVVVVVECPDIPFSKWCFNQY